MLVGCHFAEIQLWDYGVVFQMTAEAVAELWSLVFLAPCFCTDLRSSIDPELTLVDASSEWMAEVTAELPPVFAAELSRHKLTKGCLVSFTISAESMEERERGP